MDVFVIPVGPDRYELYYERGTDLDPKAEPPATGILAKLLRRFEDLLRAAEEHHDRPAQRDARAHSWRARLQDRLLSWVAERIAEHRLLWNLRKQTAVTAVHPSDVDFDQVVVHIRRVLQHDYERHWRWMIVDGLAFLVTGIVLGPLFLLVPGVANLPAFYFGFRAFGHWLSMRGATQGRRHVAWTSRPSEALERLRAVLTLERRDRHRQVHEIATELHLRNLPVFFERVARAKKKGAGDSGSGTRGR